MRKPAFAILLLALCASVVRAEPLVLSVQDAVALARGASLEVYGQGLAVARASRDADNAWNLFLPGLSAGLSARLGDKLLTQAAISPSSTGFSTAVSLGTRLSLANGVLFDMEERRADLELASLGEADAVARLARDVEKAYFTLASLGLDMGNKAKAADLARERSKLAGLRFDRGLGSELDALRAQLAERNALAAHRKAVADYGKRMAAFKRQLGLDPGVELRLSTALEAPGSVAEGPFDDLVDARTDLERSRLAMRVAATAAARYAAVNRLPLLTLEAGWNFGLADFETARDAFTLSAGLSFNADAWIPNSRKDLELRALRDTEKRLALAYEQARRAALDEVAALRADIEYASDGIDLATAQESLAARILARAREAYDRGSATGLELEDAELALGSARQSLIASRFQYLSLVIDLGYALGVDWRSLVR
ncbi:MAG: TolC family protein [Spirochaetes bacterium]|nr:TolC family protein [Spirochaetota bacterium]MBU1080367.1 TolC family protein [Spirochaetota bacterium]